MENVAKHGQSPTNILSYHGLIFLSNNIRTPKLKSKTISHRNFRKMNLKIFAEMPKTSTGVHFLILNVSKNLIYLQNNLICLYEKHAPMRQIIVKYLPAPLHHGLPKE